MSTLLSITLLYINFHAVYRLEQSWIWKVFIWSSGVCIDDIAMYILWFDREEKLNGLVWLYLVYIIFSLDTIYFHRWWNIEADALIYSMLMGIWLSLTSLVLFCLFFFHYIINYDMVFRKVCTKILRCDHHWGNSVTPFTIPVTASHSTKSSTNISSITFDLQQTNKSIFSV